MRICINPIGEGPTVWRDWPDEWRIPVVGELIIIEEFFCWEVASVQWELPAEEADFIVQLRVVRAE